MAFQRQVHWLQDGSPREPASKNEEILALLDQWTREPDDLGADWWASFDQELKANRFRSIARELP
jgi:hypothetical protein